MSREPLLSEQESFTKLAQLNDKLQNAIDDRQFKTASKLKEEIQQLTQQLRNDLNNTERTTRGTDATNKLKRMKAQLAKEKERFERLTQDIQESEGD